MNRTTLPIEELLPRYMEGTLDEDQVRQVEVWLAASPKHRQIAADMARAYRGFDDLYIVGHTDTESALRNVSARIRRTRLTVVIRRLERAAAVLFIPLLLSAGILFYQAFHTNPAEMLSVATNPGMTATALLPDGTKVTLNSNSKLTYPARFDGDERPVNLSGEAYFEVTKKQRQPFIVNTPYHAQVKVYGTHFNVEIDEEARQIISTLAEGSIGLNYRTASHRWDERTILPGQQIVYSIDRQNAVVRNAEVDVATAWKDGKLIFRNTPVKAVLHSLGKRFDVKFVVRNPRVYRNSFTGTLDHQRLDRILEILSLSSTMKFRHLPNADIRQRTQTIEIYE